MPEQHGRLKKDDENKIRVHYVEIKNNIDGKEFTDEFYSQGVFTYEDKEEIDREKTRLARAELFLGKLFHSGPYGAYPAFVKVVNIKYQGLAEIFNEEIPASEYPSKYYSWFDTVKDERRAKIPTDKELSDLAQCFIFNWQNAYLDLGFTSGELEQGYIRLKENAHAQMTQHLVTLKNKNSAFTFKYLIDKLVNLEKGGNTFFDWDTIKAIVNGDNPARLVS
ncbi:uncharacterized protein LOC131947869 [Physella acuta]|uniref:uncharacterized protein LOC131947869 n=1 Tax=Physella acuta TaxID=109671 RepID=UPI0027DE9D8A|nr:uncharacterized protein LOC131947869 [Physella acuta]XP_059165233.1 uncharacterized protein LOC131947869 [Physella acuta]XP_059165234.1 uncharacterized protein LOC131947869 [Physella acuta]XP_059165235.1 uncharacterized protein LOC131947869 [Physella acuta]XP_059165236.1 uncharacterized protein LOC131947869 [Physella acuta]